ncbi:hypothetical protein BMS3Bbin09_01699 [bacterium BMS3Bbin09]|nr:hypothetical protein BMS3Bbin09_01699 [bacterium BMS3Bbin09]
MPGLFAAEVALSFDHLLDNVPVPDLCPHDLYPVLLQEELKTYIAHDR